jgi:hypothetical protein
MKEAVTIPFEIAHVDVPTAFPDNEQVTSAVEKPDPVISIIDPVVAEIGLILMEGTLSIEVVVWLGLVVASVEVVCIEVEVVVIVWLEVVKSSLMFVPVRVTVLVIGPNPGPEAVTVIVPELPIGIA